MRSLALLAVCPLWGALQQAPVPALEPDGDSGSPSVSDDGRYVAFESRAANFVAGDQKDTWDVFLLDRESGVIARISEAGALAARSPVVSGDGRWILFLQAQPARATTPEGWSETEFPWRVARYARAEGVLDWIGEARPTWRFEQAPTPPSISRDGSLAVFAGSIRRREVIWCYDAGRKSVRELGLAKNVRDLEARISLGQPQISADGRFVAFASTSPQIAKLPEDFTGYTNSIFDEDKHVYRHELSTGKSEYASHFVALLTGSGGAVSPRLSADGRYVAYDNPDPSYMESLHVAFVSDLQGRQAGRLLPLRKGPDFWQSRVSIAWLSGDGRRVLVHSSSPAVPGMPLNCDASQTLLRDLDSDTWEVISRAPDGVPANGATWAASAAEDGSVFAFISSATNLVPGDSNELSDLFLYEPEAKRTTRVVPRLPVPRALPRAGASDEAPHWEPNGEPNGESGNASISEEGRFVAFLSSASNFDEADRAATWDVFLSDLEDGSVRRVSSEPHEVVSRPSISADGGSVAYWSTRGADRFPAPWDLRIHDVATGKTRVVEGLRLDAFTGEPCDAPQLSRDGSRIAFVAHMGAWPDGPRQAMVLDTKSGETTIASLGDTGGMSPVEVGFAKVSADGRSIGFVCTSPTLAPAYLADGRPATAFVGGGNAYVRNLERGRTFAASAYLLDHLQLERVDFPRDWSCSGLLLSGDGTVAAFDVESTSLAIPKRRVGFVARRLEDRFSDLRPLVSAPGTLAGAMRITWLSASGDRVLVSACGLGLPGAADERFAQVLLGHSFESRWLPISRNAAGEFANRSARAAVASGDLSRIVFESEADNLVPGDTNNARDLFIVDRKAKSIVRIVPR